MYSDIGFSASKGRSYSGTVLEQLVAGPPFSLLCHHGSSGFQREGTPSLLKSPKVCPVLLTFLRISWEGASLGRSAEEEHPATPVQLHSKSVAFPVYKEQPGPISSAPK